MIRSRRLNYFVHNHFAFSWHVLATLGIGLAIVFMACSRKSDSNPAVARVANRLITQQAYEQRLKNLTMLTPVDNAQIRDALLQAMIDEQVLLLEADRRGLREQEDFKHRAESFRIDAVLEAYRESLVDTVTVQESEIKEAFALAHEKAAARHLYAPTLEEANALYEKLRAGATFEELAPQVFKDYRLASTGGYLGYLKWEDMDPTFAAEAQKLKKGEISKPVRTKYGYSIIKLEDRVRESFLTETEYGQQRKKLKWVTEHRKRARTIMKLDAETLAGLHIQFNQATLDQMWQQIQQARADSNQRIESDSDFAVLPPTAMVATVAGKAWTVKDFQERAVWTSARQRNKIQSIHDLKDFISGLALREEYLRRAKDAGFEKDPKVQQRIRDNENRFLIEKMKSLLTDTVRVPEDSLRQVYQEQPQYQIYPAMMKLREITVTSREQANLILRQLKAGVNFAELAKRYSVRKWTAERGGEVGYVMEGELGQWGKAIFKLKKGEFGGPYQQDAYFTIVQVLDIKPARQKTFVEAKPDIEEVLLPVFKQRALEKQLQALRQPLTIEVDQKVLEQVKSPL
ncbi:MAG: peptidylprolyl isomerase [candidate division KSB1 bacterium]|nr:peptidylprolyl isomerase [candidate division KSB1 bacterium]MDZ7301045.1 peptidylprolyl isomerase [candidate division KSB1 bacterium]MDZ7312130.1 peptidylprolyl isomerase [candidate division KSB1 bacterium]